MLWNLFAKNPFRSLKEHMKKTSVCVGLTVDIFEALFAGDKYKVSVIAKEISRTEHECDDLKKEIRTHLTQSVFLPVDRRDLLHVLSNMDSIADHAEDLGVLLTLRWMELPVELQPEFRELLQRSQKVVEESAYVIDSLDRLLETGFSGPDADEMLAKIDEIDRLEHLADKAQDAFGKALFAREDDFKPAALFMWIKISNKVGDLANSSERMVNHIRWMLS
jgi:predicted phosphate transport protein (TIGR00153 family)